MVTAYSPLGTLESASIMKRHNDTPSLMQEPTVKKVADKLGKAPAQVTLSLSLLLEKKALTGKSSIILVDRSQVLTWSASESFPPQSCESQ